MVIFYSYVSLPEGTTPKKNSWDVQNLRFFCCFCRGTKAIHGAHGVHGISSSTAQGGGRFKGRKPIGEVGLSENRVYSQL